MAQRTPVPTPRRSCRARQPPQRYEDFITKLPLANTIATEDDSEISATTNISTASRRSVRSARAAALRVEQLRKEHELQQRSEEASRALELHRACSELEMATLEDEERAADPEAQE